MLYSTYRPLNFQEVVGQDNNLITLKEQVKQNKFDSAYLFAGHRGTGKTTIARILARAINCSNVTPEGPCNECDSCLSMLKNATLDFVELDAASHNSINDICWIFYASRDACFNSAVSITTNVNYQSVLFPY